jgi:hypothetical protein
LIWLLRFKGGYVNDNQSGMGYLSFYNKWGIFSLLDFDQVKYKKSLKITKV